MFVLQWISSLRNKIPKGQNFIWWLIKKEGGIWTQRVSPLLFFFVYGACFWLPIRNIEETVSLSLALLIQMYLHELGHAFVFTNAGIKNRIWWLFPLGAVATPIDKDENARSDKLPWWTIAWLLQAGPTMNVILMIVGFYLQHITFLPWVGSFGQNLLYTGGLLAISNLLPVWQLDASHLFKTLFSSLKKEDDIKLAWVLILVLVGIVALAFWSAGSIGFWDLLIVLVTRLSWLIVIPIVAGGVWHHQGSDNDEYAQSNQAMTKRQVVIHVLWYMMLLFLSLRLLDGPITNGFL